MSVELTRNQLKLVTGGTFTASVAAQVLKEIKGGALPK